MNLRSPLAQARGLGAAKQGLGHWWMQRLTALALIPLALWFVYSVAVYHAASYPTLVAWVHNPYVAVALILWFVVLYYHSALGVQVVIEDYVGSEMLRLALIVLEKFAHAVLAAVCIFSVLKLAFGGA